MKQVQLFILLLFTAFSFAQERTVEGKVVDKSGEPIIGATVRVPDTNVGTITDAEGNFVLNGVPADASKLQVSYLGSPMMFDITDGFMNVSFGIEDTFIDDVVVFGYGEIERTRFTGAASKVGEKVMEDKSVADITNALAGEVAGLQVFNNNGQPGTASVVRIRGFGSQNGNRDPLFVVDGVPYAGDLSSLNTADIESTTVLKDASATAIYGSRGANGVVIITTKKGRSGQNNIEVDVKHGVNYRGLDYYDVIQSPEEYTEIGWDGIRQFTGDPNMANAILFGGSGGLGLSDYYNLWGAPGDALIDPSTGKFFPNVNRKYTPERRRDVLFNNAPRTEANVSLNGGEGKTTYNTSFGVLDEEGYFLASEFRRLTGKVDVSHKVKPWLRGNMNLQYSDQRSNTPGQGTASSVNGFFLERNAPSIYGIYLRNPDGSILQDPIFGGPQFDFGDGTFNDNSRRFSSLSNITGVNTLDDNFANDNILFGNADLVATFLKNFDFTFRFGAQSMSFTNVSRANPFYGQSSGSNGSLSRTERNILQYSAQQILSYSNELGTEDEHVFTVTGLHEAISFSRDLQNSSGTNLADPFGTHFNNVLDHNPNTSFNRSNTTESYGMFANYSFKEKYLFNASIRRDGSSIYAPDNRWGTFWAVGAGWEATKEDFLKDVKWLDYLKLRTSIGEVGDQGITFGSSYYRGNGNTFDITSSGGQPSFVFREAIDPNLTWETSRQFDFGLEADVFNDRLSATVDYYDRRVRNQFYFRQQGPSAGVAGIFTNDGVLANSGIELELYGKLVKTNDLNVNLSVMATTLTNKWIEPATDPATGEFIPVQRVGSFAFSEGRSIYDYYLPEFVGVDPQTGFSQWKRYYDDVNTNGSFDAGDVIIRDYVDYLATNNNVNVEEDLTSNYSEATFKYTGHSAIPDIQGATRLEVDYKGFSLTGQFLYSVGAYGRDGNYQTLMANDIFGSNNVHADMRNRWQQPGDITNVPRLTNGQVVDGVLASWQNASSTRFLTKADYLILNNVRLNYQIPEKMFNKLGLQGASVWVSGDNLFARTARDGYFAFQAENGIPVRENYDPLSTFTTGVKFKF